MLPITMYGTDTTPNQKKALWLVRDDLNVLSNMTWYRYYIMIKKYSDDRIWKRLLNRVNYNGIGTI
jgi:hypothetical protein